MMLSSGKESPISLPRRFIESLRRKTERHNGYAKREYLNADGTKRFVLIADPDSIKDVEYYDISLDARGFAEGWAPIMSLIKRNLDGKTQFVIEVGAIKDGDPLWSTGTFKYSEEGSLEDFHEFFWTPRDHNGKKLIEEERAYLHNLGYYHLKDLPQHIDFDKTAKSFIEQAKNLNFDVPKLFAFETSLSLT